MRLENSYMTLPINDIFLIGFKKSLYFVVKTSFLLYSFC